MKRLILAALCVALIPGVARAAQAVPVPQCQYAPAAVQAGTPGDCGQVLGFIGGDGKFHRVTAADPLPSTVSGGGGSTMTVGVAYGVSGKTPVASTFAATGQSASFTPLAGRGFNVSLWGTFVATVQLERSFDSGSTWLPLTAAGTQLYKWTAAASEAAEEDENSVLYRLNCNAYTSGTVNYRVSQ